MIIFGIMKSILNQKDYQELVERVNRLTPETKAKWGRMDAAQMLAHVSEVQEVKNGKPLKNTPIIARLFKGYIRKMVFNDVPYKPNTRTHPQYVVSLPQSFETQKQRFLNAMAVMHNENPDTKHRLFGKMTDEEKGWGCYKHINHHLEQFGV